MQQQYSFKPRGNGNTVNLAVGVAAANVPLTTLPAEGGTVRLVNSGTQTVFIAFGATATVAAGMPMLGNTVETFTLAPTDTISAIASATGSTLYATVGDGQ
jgi:hypothetical protein